jgi:hypothetical protein
MPKAGQQFADIKIIKGNISVQGTVIADELKLGGLSMRVNPGKKDKTYVFSSIGSACSLTDIGDGLNISNGKLSVDRELTLTGTITDYSVTSLSKQFSVLIAPSDGQVDNVEKNTVQMYVTMDGTLKIRKFDGTTWQDLLSLKPK